MAPGIARLRVPELLAERGWSISDFMRKSGLSWPTAWRLAKGEVSAVNMKTIDTLCEVFGVTVDELIVREDDGGSG